jgi:ubiquitin-conjugating enzyme E2 Q
LRQGVYFALQGDVSMGSYAQAAQTRWKNSSSAPSMCVALAEIVNLPSEFVSRNPYLVVSQTDWIIWYAAAVPLPYFLPHSHPGSRYLLVRTLTVGPEAVEAGPAVPFVTLDPHFKLTVGGKSIQIPQPTHKIDEVLRLRQQDLISDGNDATDRALFERGADGFPGRVASEKPICVEETDDEKMDDDPEDYDETWMDDDGDGAEGKDECSAESNRVALSAVTVPVDDWKHDEEWVRAGTQFMMGPPSESSTGATIALQRELRQMLKEQKAAKNLRDLGWYMPEAFIDDNLYQWIVELHSFEESLPIAEGMKAKSVLASHVRLGIVSNRSPSTVQECELTNPRDPLPADVSVFTAILQNPETTLHAFLPGSPFRCFTSSIQFNMYACREVAGMSL